MKTLATQSLCRPARKWQWLAIGSGLVLAAGFLLPCGPKGAAVPMRMTLECVRDFPRDWTLREYWHYAAVWFLTAESISSSVPYLAGAFLAFAAASRLAGCRWALALAKVTGLVLFVAVLCLAIAEIRMWTPDWVASGRKSKWGHLSARDLTRAHGPVIFLIYLALAQRLRGRTFLAHAFATGLAASLWFGIGGPTCTSGSVLKCVMRPDHLVYCCGQSLSFAAAIGLTLAAIGEAASVTTQSWGGTTLQLLTCRLAPPVDMTGHCPRCNYNLYGLAEQRCPECGRVFTFEEIGATPEEMGFGEAKGDSAQEEAV